MIPSAFGAALKYLVPHDVEILTERTIESFCTFDKLKTRLPKTILQKRVDFVLRKKERLFFIEFKTNLNFNDLAAAAVEMAIVKHCLGKKSIRTNSLHFWPWLADVDGLKAVNELVQSPIDDIWVFCKMGKNGLPLFDSSAVADFQKSVAHWAKQKK